MVVPTHYFDGHTTCYLPPLLSVFSSDGVNDSFRSRRRRNDGDANGVATVAPAAAVARGGRTVFAAAPDVEDSR